MSIGKTLGIFGCLVLLDSHADQNKSEDNKPKNAQLLIPTVNYLRDIDCEHDALN